MGFHVAAVAAIFAVLSDGAAAGEITMQMPAGIEWTGLPKETMGESYERQWIPAGSNILDAEWVIVEQRLSVAKPMTAEAVMALMRELSREGCAAVKFDGPYRIDSAIGQGVRGRTYCTHDLDSPYGTVSDLRIVVDGTVVFIVTSALRTRPHSVPGGFTFGSGAESEAFRERMARSADFVAESVRIAEPSSEPANGVHIEVPGNLAATNALDCVAAETVSNSFTAADITSGARACLDMGNYDRMADLLLVANAFAYYDTLRVTDTSAHAALSALFAEQFADISSAQRDRAGTAIDALAGDDARVGALCANLADLEPPEYLPTYMLAHGLAHLIGDEKEPPLREIDRAAGWREALTFTKCPESRSGDRL
ncbi:MAG: hypothetical protein F4029_11150 [Gammaproteobacteria bacterium]|nr:hypothetical protein [Gammaproteobacteria bacterium]MYF30393.1 hypothetical protein [Gammaproteobacteria bacterium]MYK46769.1 hypothetical protein [Gammaproteobacteria bacterium]